MIEATADLIRELRYYQGVKKQILADMAKDRIEYDEMVQSGYAVLPYEEILYIIHWRKRLAICDELIEFFRRQMGRKHGRN